MVNPESTQDHKNTVVKDTSLMAIGIAGFDIAILFAMNAGLQNGIGIASIAVASFFGMLMVSSYFEEHRHNHDDEEIDDNAITIGTKIQDNALKSELEVFLNGKSKNIKVVTGPQKKIFDKDHSFLVNIVAGKGIMRKAIAGSLIITYAIFLGLYMDNGELNQAFPGFQAQKTPETDKKSEETQDTLGVLSASNGLVMIQQEDSSSKPSDSNKESEKKSNESDPSSTQKPIPKSLLEHFTLIITTIIGFYFGTDIVKFYAKGKASQSDKSEVTNLKSELENSKKETKKTNKIINNTLTQLIEKSNLSQPEKDSVKNAIKNQLNKE